MKVGFIELMPVGHYTLVDTMVRIYASSQEHEIFIFTTEKGKHELAKTQREFPAIKFIVWNEKEPLGNYLHHTDDLDKVYIITLENYLKDIGLFSYRPEVNLFVHNMDSWLQSSWDKALSSFFGLRKKTNWRYALKAGIIYPRTRKKIIARLRRSNGKIVVLNKTLYTTAAALFPRVEIVPFSLYDPQKTIPVTDITGRIRICVPGYVSATRRNYYSVFETLRKFQSLRDEITLDLLGGVSSAENGKPIIEEAAKLISKGYDIRFYDCPMVSLDDFENEIRQAHIILGNLYIIQGKHSAYGVSKESGIPFAQISWARPGILPAEYQVMEEIASSTLQFNDYDELGKLLVELTQDRPRLVNLIDKATKNSHKFVASRILAQLEKK